MARLRPEPTHQGPPQDGPRDPSRTDDYFGVLYRELRSQAIAHRARWHGNLTVNATALVHEAYLKLSDRDGTPFSSKAHFLAVASKAMRQVLIDYARQRGRKKRGGAVAKVSLDEAFAPQSAISEEDRADILLSLEDSLTRLARMDERAALVVECRFFGGMSTADIAQALDVSERTVRRDWSVARAWLKRDLSESA